MFLLLHCAAHMRGIIKKKNIQQYAAVTVTHTTSLRLYRYLLSIYIRLTIVTFHKSNFITIHTFQCHKFGREVISMYRFFRAIT